MSTKESSDGPRYFVAVLLLVAIVQYSLWFGAKAFVDGDTRKFVMQMVLVSAWGMIVALISISRGIGYRPHDALLVTIPWVGIYFGFKFLWRGVHAWRGHRYWDVCPA